MIKGNLIYSKKYVGDSCVCIEEYLPQVAAFFWPTTAGRP